VLLTEEGNPHITNHGIEDTYAFTNIEGISVPRAQHGDAWIKPEKARAFMSALNTLVAEYPGQRVHLNDCSAFNPNVNLGHAANGAHSRGDGFDSMFLTVDGTGTNVIGTLTQADIIINGRFVELLKATGQFSKFHSDRGPNAKANETKGLIPGSTHVDRHADHLHGD